jgi:hypothetical protein
MLKRFRCRLQDYLRIQIGKWVCEMDWAQVWWTFVSALMNTTLAMKRYFWNIFSYCGSFIFICEVRPGPSMMNWAFLRADGKGFFSVAVALISWPCTASPSSCKIGIQNIIGLKEKSLIIIYKFLFYYFIKYIHFKDHVLLIFTTERNI